MNLRQLSDFDLLGKRVLIRQDLNVPVSNGRILSANRIEASLPTIRLARDAGARVMLMSHLGQPEEGQYNVAYSMGPVADYLSCALGQPVRLHCDYLNEMPDLDRGQVGLLENVRFNRGESSNDAELSRSYAALCDVYVMDAFGTAHRVQASTYGVGLYAPMACAGPLLTRELGALDKALSAPERPMTAIVGGAKVSTKLTVLNSLSRVVDRLIPGGGIANTFIAAAGYGVGKSLYEPGLVDQAKALVHAARARGSEIPIPADVVVGQSFSSEAAARVIPVSEVADDDMILDIGPETTARYCEMVGLAGTIVWNGPVGVFEFGPFSSGTRKLGNAIARSDAFSIAGGGDTLAAVDQFGLSESISYISTGGGAFLKYLEGGGLPAVEMLQRAGRARQSVAGDGPRDRTP